jgi:hypothetical protein
LDELTGGLGVNFEAAGIDFRAYGSGLSRSRFPAFPGKKPRARKKGRPKADPIERTLQSFTDWDLID